MLWAYFKLTNINKFRSYINNKLLVINVSKLANGRKIKLILNDDVKHYIMKDITEFICQRKRRVTIIIIC
jgi:hypothetical protein